MLGPQWGRPGGGGAGSQPQSPPRFPSRIQFQNPGELKINVVRILNLNFRTCHSQAYVELSSYTDLRGERGAGARNVYSVRPGEFS